MRAFVIVVVLAAAAVIAASVGATLLGGQKGDVASLRGQDEVRARAIARGCLELASAYVDDYMPDSLAARSPARPDFDELLNGPNNILGDGDDFMVGVSSPVVSVQIPTSAGDRFHRYELIDLPGSGGKCAVRLDDNSDDGRPDLPGAGAVTTPNAEGPEPTNNGADVPDRDRDLAVYITVIGLFPVLPATTNADAYTKAHARVTLRRLVQKESVFTPLAPALWAGDTVDMKNNNDVCAAGGIIGDSVDLDNNSCVCGEVECQDDCPSTATVRRSCSGCPTCAPGSISPQPSDPPKPPVNIHWATITNFRDNEILGAAGRVAPDDDPLPKGDGIGAGFPDPPPATSYNLGNSAVCAFYGKAIGATDHALFVWDAKDTDPVTTLNTLAGVAAVKDAGGTALAPGAAGSCSTVTADPLPAPCTWSDGAGNLTAPTELLCNLASQSPCWKLLGHLGASGDDIGLGADARTSLLSAGSFRPKSAPGSTVPNTNNRHFGAPADADLICGSNPTSNCTTCGLVPVNPLSVSASQWSFNAAAVNASTPSPSVWLLEALPGGAADVTLSGTGAAPGMFRASIATNGSVDLGGNSSICCASCDCGVLTGAATAGNCILNSTFGGSPTVVQDLVSDNPGNTDYNPTNLGQVGGIAIKAGLGVTVSSINAIVGDIRAGTVTFTSNNACVVGSVVGYGGAAPTCNSSAESPCDTDARVCFPGNNANVIGDVMAVGSLSLKNNVKIWGTVAAKTSACFKNNASIEGVIQAGDTIEFKNNATVINTTTAGGEETKANAKVVTFMEPTW